MNKKFEYKGQLIYSKMLRKICKKKAQGEFCQCYPKLIFRSKLCIYLVYAQNISWSALQLYRARHEIFLYYKTDSFFLTVNLSHTLVCSVHLQGFVKCSWRGNFFIQKFYCFMLLLSLNAFRYAFFKRIIQVWYQYSIFRQLAMILVQFGEYISTTCTAKYVQFLPIFPISSSPFTVQVPFIK